MRARNWDLIGRLLDRTAEAIMITDAGSRIVYVNRSFTKVTGYGQREVWGRTPDVLHSGRQPAAFYAAMWKDLTRLGRWQGEIWNRRKNGEIYPEWLSITAVRNRSGAVENYLAIFSDITARKREERALYERATHDGLTRLPNRFLFRERLRHALVRAKRSGHLVALLYVDLDRFKAVNDALGHRYGDLLLREAARRLRRSVREEDTIGRLGGDEFGVVLDRLSRPRDAEGTAAKILRALMRPFRLKRRAASVAASIGISVYPGAGGNVETLIKRADAAMYRAKAAGGSGYRYWREPRVRRAAPRRR